MHKILKELDSHFIVELPNGVTIKVAKGGLSEQTKHKVMFLAEGGYVPDKGFIPENYVPSGKLPPMDSSGPVPGEVVPLNDLPKTPATFARSGKATEEELMQAAEFAPGTPDIYKTAVDQPRPVRQAPIEPGIKTPAPGGAEEALISPLDFPVEAAALAGAGAKGLARAAMAGREAVYKAAPRLASEVGAIGGRKVEPRINPLGMYSKLEQTLEEKMGGSATPEQIKGMLRDVKPEEMQYSGLNDFIQGKDKISKQEILDFVKANELPVQEKVLGKPVNLEWLNKNERVQTPDGEFWITENPNKEGKYKYALNQKGHGSVMASNDIESLKNMASKQFAKEANPTKFSSYTLPGGENYREKLYTLPVTKKEFNLFDKNKEANVFYNKTFDKLSDEEKLTVMNSLKFKDNLSLYKSNYESSHWSEPNVLAHTRLNDRIDDEGRKHLFVEEIQSDWHQAGRKEILNKQKEIDEKALKETGLSSTEEAYKLRPDLLEQKNKISSEYKYEYTPDAPMKKTWQEFVSKNLLNDAAKGGYDNISWTTGAQQAERYDLSKQVKDIEVYTKLDGTKDVTISGDRGGGILWSGNVSKPEELEDVVGKELATKVFEQKNRKGDYPAILSGNDLKIGGEGMEGFYDKIIPDYMAKIGKKYGVKPEKIDIPTDKFSINSAKNDRNAFIRWAQLEKNKDIQALEDIGDEKTLNKLREQYQESLKDYKKNTQQVWTMKITPEMRKDIIEKGLPLYSVGGAVAGGMLGNNEAEAKSMNYKMLENKKDHYVMKHPDGSTFKVAKKGLKPEVMKKIEGYADFMQKAEGGEIPGVDMPEQTASFMPEQPKEPDFAQMAQASQPSKQELMDQKIGEAQARIEDRMLGAYAKSGLPESYTPERFRQMAEEEVLGQAEKEALKQKNQDFLNKEEQARKLQETLSYNERAARVGMPLRPIPGQKQELPLEAQAKQVEQPEQVSPTQPQQKAVDPFALYEKGIRGESAAKAEYGKQQAEAYKKLGEEMVDGNKKFNEKLAKLYEQGDVLKKAAEQKNIDPNRYWSNAGIGNKISASIGLILGGIGAGLTGTENAAMKIIEKTIDNDIEAQKKNVDQANNLYRMNLDAIKDEREAYNVTKAQKIGLVEMELKKALAQSSSKEAIAQGQMALGKLELMKQELLQKSAIDTVLQAAQTNPKLLTPEIIQKLPEKDRELVVPGYGFAISKAGAEKIRTELLPQKDTSVEMIDDLINIRKKYGREITDREVVARAKALKTFIDGNMRLFVVGPGAVTPDERKIIDNVIADPTKVISTDAGTIASLNGLKEGIERSFNNQAKANGLLIPKSQAQGQQPVRGDTGKFYIQQGRYMVPVNK